MGIFFSPTVQLRVLVLVILFANVGKIKHRYFLLKHVGQIVINHSNVK